MAYEEDTGGGGGETYDSEPLAEAHSLNVEGKDLQDDFLEEGGPKAELLNAIRVADGSGDEESVRFDGFSLGGFGVDSSSDRNDDKDTIEKLVKDISGYVLPLDKPSEWKLVYTSAPDLLGFQGGPLSKLVSIRQKVVDNTSMELVLEYQPSNNVVQFTKSFWEDIEENRLTQTIGFEYTVGSMNKVDVQLVKTSIEASRLLGNNSNNNNASPPSLQSPTPIPFVGFSIVFNDGDLRVDRSVQGDFLSIYKRIC